MRVYIPVSAGDLIDRITILEIKKVRIPDRKKLANVENELQSLIAIRNCFPKLQQKAIRAKERQLSKANQVLWDTEDEIRALEARESFDKVFVAAARRVYRTNDQRAKLKAQINALAGSALREEKWFSENP
ncbi:MAG: hypothetical protein ISS15_11840 [Alphaproteobacteria bacterium]|nr:hypothetical protein [Alphaproteobacteria bacterium]MBL6936606.1 hypothetical protein [Alphaproteobacteria bacterium]MBL7098343.1 hypothetical protein [Alphaproteobacteria bacterium]